MKTTFILSALGALSFASTTSFAQDYVTYSSAYGNAQRTISATAPYGNAHPTINAAAPLVREAMRKNWFGQNALVRARAPAHSAAE